MMKELLCIPYGGLNDTLVQISRCYEYAKIYKRRLLIDTSKSVIFLDFGLYFDLNPQLDCKVTTVIDDDTFDRLNLCLSVKPFEFKGMIRDVALGMSQLLNTKDIHFLIQVSQHHLISAVITWKIF